MYAISTRIKAVVSSGTKIAYFQVKSAKIGDHMITTDPMATSTPLDGSPAANGRIHPSTSYVFNRSGISSITASTAHEIVQLQQSDIELQVMVVHF